MDHVFTPMLDIVNTRKRIVRSVRPVPQFLSEPKSSATRRKSPANRSLKGAVGIGNH